MRSLVFVEQKREVCISQLIDKYLVSEGWEGEVRRAERTNTEGRDVCKSSVRVTAELTQPQKRRTGGFACLAYLSITFKNRFWRVAACQFLFYN